MDRFLQTKIYNIPFILLHHWNSCFWRYIHSISSEMNSYKCNLCILVYLEKSRLFKILLSLFFFFSVFGLCLKYDKLEQMLSPNSGVCGDSLTLSFAKGLSQYPWPLRSEASQRTRNANWAWKQCTPNYPKPLKLCHVRRVEGGLLVGRNLD